MSNTELQLKRIQEKIQLLLKQHATLQKDHSRVKEELELARLKAKTSQESVEELKQQVSILKISSGSMNEADKKELEKKISGYLREIDRCIALLGE